MRPILREFVQSGFGCYNFGAYHAAFVLAACAVEATAKRRFPDEHSSARRVKAFLRDHMPDLCGIVEYWVAVEMPEDRSSVPVGADGHPNLPRVGDDFRKGAGKPRLVLMEGVLYHAFRCALAHEANLQEVELLAPLGGRQRIQVDAKIRVSADLIGALLGIVVNSPENRETFPEAHDSSGPAAVQ